MTKLKILVILCSVLLSFSLSGDDNSHTEYKKNHIYKNLEYLNLNKEQYNSIKKILIDYRKDYKNFYRYKEREEKKLQELMKMDEFDKEKYEDYAKVIYEKSINLEAETLKRIHSVLNTQQREKFSLYLREWRVE